jgi:glycosyltransferase involved in cell wall biosynthesis
MEILVMVSDYSTQTSAAMGFVHTRNINYIKYGNINVTVLCFRAEKSYVLDGIPVYAYADYKTKLAGKKFDLLLSHAPNLREHLRFLRKYGDAFPKIVFFFHGHEVLIRNKEYPWPYAFRKKDRLIRTFIQAPYDVIKLIFMRRTIEKLGNRIHLIFVSNWLKKRFVSNVRLMDVDVNSISSVIHNVAAEEFCRESYVPSAQKEGDFITIRSNLDDSKYAVDVVRELAVSNPSLSFSVFGNGEFFKHNPPPDNLKYKLGTLRHGEITGLLNQYRCALMPTRQDTQGVMSCEMAMFGIPLVTSGIDVCHEILGGMENIAFIDNEKPASTDLSSITNGFDTKKNNKHITRFSLEETVGKEIALFRGLMER